MTRGAPEQALAEPLAPAAEAPAAPQESWLDGWRRDIRAVRKEITMIVAAATLAASSLVIAYSHDRPDGPVVPSTPQPGKVPKGNEGANSSLVKLLQGDQNEAPRGTRYMPATNVLEVSGGREALEAKTEDRLAALGHTVEIMRPDADFAHSYKGFFDAPGIHPEGPPALKEVISIQDANTFSRVYARHPNTYPFLIYNTTDKPVDLLFVSYALRATQVWLNETHEKQDPGVEDDINIDDDTLADVKSTSDPHYMIMTDHIPSGAKNSPRSTTDGVTETIPGVLTRSFIESDDSEPGFEPFARQSIATEICQSLVEVADEHAVPGEWLEQWLIRIRSGRLFNRPNTIYDLDLASQERVCNGLGSYITAAYTHTEDGGEQRLKQADFKAVIFKPVSLVPGKALIPGMSVEAQWIDYSLYEPQNRKFVWIARHIMDRDHNVPIFSRSTDTPTADFYRHHQK